MTPSSPTMSSRPTSVDMRAIQRRASASSRIVDRRRQCRPINPAKIVVEYPDFATIALRTFSRVSPTPAPPAAAPRSTHLTKALGQDVHEKAAHELVGVQRQRLGLVLGAIIVPPKADAAILAIEKTAVGDGDAMRVATEIIEDL